MDAVFDHARAAGMVGDREEVSVDSTGLENGRRSAHYACRTGQAPYLLRRWPKLTLACHNATHLLVSALITEGPSHDYRLLLPTLHAAAGRVRLDRVIADAGYDSEANHALARRELGVRSTVIDLNRRGKRRWAKGRYRRQMQRRFPRRVYRRRVQAESTISRFKRRLSPVVRARSPAAQEREIRLRILTHNLLLLAK